MQFANTILDLIGNTPLVKLNKLVTPEMATILCKMEPMNPAGSVKDRMALRMVEEAEADGTLKPGGTLVESTSGNTGLGLAMVAAVKGYRCVFTIPDKMSKEKIDMLKAYGAEVIVTPADRPHEHPENYVQVAIRMAKETPNALYTDQYHNMSNPEAHYLTTGPEIWSQTDGKIDALVGGIGTGGTISGAGKYLKEKAREAGREVQIICPDPIGSIYPDLYYRREMRPAQAYAIEGIGHDFMVGTLDFSVIDEVMEISDRDSFLTARKLCRDEGMFVGGSTGTAVYGALEVARRLGPEKTIVVIICDTGGRYLTRCFDDEWMKDKGFFDYDERLGCVGDVLAFTGGVVEFAGADESIHDVAIRMNTLGISQMPLRHEGAADGAPLRMVHESDLLHCLVDGSAKSSDPIGGVASPLQGVVSRQDPTRRIQEILDSENVAVVVDADRVVGIVSKIDVVRFLSSRQG